MSDTLSYGEALVELAEHTPFRTAAAKAAVIKAIQVEHGLYVRPQAETLELELEQLRAMKAAKDKADAEAARDAELAALRAELGVTPAPAADEADSVPPAEVLA
jgi:hypothetical protein